MTFFAVAVGILFGLFWIAQLIFVKIHLGWTHKILKSDKRDENAAVSVIHPVKDLDFEFEKNLESWMKQDYIGHVQHIFSFQDPDDPAIKVVETLKGKYHDADIALTVNPLIKSLNGKSSNMVNGLKLAKYDIVMFGDSDIRVGPDFILKMVRPLVDEKIGVTTCGQINIGGRDFWTRFFTFIQNNETNFLWAFLTKLGMDVGITGAAFAMRKKLVLEIGGLEAYGGSLLEDMHLGNTLYRKGYKIVVGPFLECHVDTIEKEKSFNYAKRICAGIRAHIGFELPVFILMLSWYWIFFIIAIISFNTKLFGLSLIFMGARTLQGLIQRVLTMNRILLADFIMPLFFDVFGIFYLIYSSNKPFVMWRGIRYELKKDGFIRAMNTEEKIDGGHAARK